MKQEQLFTRYEESTIITKLAESIYVAHVHAGRPYVSPGLAVKLAARMFGLAQSDAMHKTVQNSAADPARATEEMQASSSELVATTIQDQQSRAEQFLHALRPNQK